MLRTEEWQEYQSPPMISQLVVSVWYHEDDESERIWIQQDGGSVSELGLDTKDAVEHVPEDQMRFVWAFPYNLVKVALESKGWTHASTTEA